MTAPRVYCTSYCNFGHRVADGKPIGHACVVLPPRALECEMAGDFEAALRLLEAARPLSAHRGIKAIVYTGEPEKRKER